ncbi:arsenic resistance protein [Microbacterium sp. P06]|uniref:arsenic resistance protein n=1 Tax=Microbacterium sp. P06 TaxID=3366949 RepID=UPI00374603A9
MRRLRDAAEHHQVVLYVAAIMAGAVVGLAAPSAAPALEAAITPVLGLLLFVTFLGVPFSHFGRALRDLRFVGSIVIANFVFVPVLVFCLSRFVAHEPALFVGVLLVLLAPCVDYVIVFAGLAGGSRDRLLAATPLLMVLQIALLPLLLWWTAGSDVVAAFEVRPFVAAFVTLIALPLAAAAATQLLARRVPPARRVTEGAPATMVPLMMLTLGIVVASQVSAVSASLLMLVSVVPLFAVFPLVAAPTGAWVARLAGVDTPGRRAAAFSAATRNSLVILPLALALPAPYALAPLVVVTQTLVELIAMVVMVSLVPRFIRDRPGTAYRS